jgi:hypothetical protein
MSLPIGAIGRCGPGAEIRTSDNGQKRATPGGPVNTSRRPWLARTTAHVTPPTTAGRCSATRTKRLINPTKRANTRE